LGARVAHYPGLNLDLECSAGELDFGEHPDDGAACRVSKEAVWLRLGAGRARRELLVLAFTHHQLFVSDHGEG
jgi:hypothetical protein